MTLKRMIAMLVVVGVLMIGTATPKPARGDVTGALILAGIATGLYVTFIVVGATVAYRNAPPLPLTAGTLDQDEREKRPTVRVGPGCSQASGDLTLVCW